MEQVRNKKARAPPDKYQRLVLYLPDGLTNLNALLMPGKCPVTLTHKIRRTATEERVAHTAVVQQ